MLYNGSGQTHGLLENGGDGSNSGEESYKIDVGDGSQGGEGSW